MKIQKNKYMPEVTLYNQLQREARPACFPTVTVSKNRPGLRIDGFEIGSIRVGSTHLFEISTMKSHVSIKSRNIFELAVTKVALNRFRVGLNQ